MTSMPINDPTAVQRRLVSELRAGIAQRDRRSSEVETEHLEAVTRAAQQQQSAEATVEGQLTGVREAVETAYTTGVAAVESQFAAEEAAVRATHASRSAEINGAYDAKTSASEQAFEETRWMVSSVLDDESTDSPKQRLDDLTTKLRRGREHLSAGVESLAEDVAPANVVDFLARQGEVRADLPASIVLALLKEPRATREFLGQWRALPMDYTGCDLHKALRAVAKACDSTPGSSQPRNAEELHQLSRRGVCRVLGTLVVVQACPVMRTAMDGGGGATVGLSGYQYTWLADAIAATRFLEDEVP